MDNKNEKTFADLFSSSSLDENETDDSKSQEVTLDSLLNEMSVDENDDTGISFGDMSNEIPKNEEFLDNSNEEMSLGDLFKTNENIENVNEIEHDASQNNNFGLNSLLKEENIINDKVFSDTDIKNDSKFNDSVFLGNEVTNGDNPVVDDGNTNLFGESSLGEEKKVSEDVVENKEVKDDIVFDDKSIEDVSNVQDSEVKENSIFFGEKNDEVDKEDEAIDFNDKELNIDNSNLFFEKEQSSTENSKNIFSIDNNGLEQKEEVSEATNLKGDEQASLGTDLFFDSSNNNIDSSDTVKSKEENLFLNDNLEDKSVDNLGDDNSVESINQMVEDKKLEKENEIKEENVSVSPFFQENSLDKNDFGIEALEDKKISFDQTKNVNSKLDKLDVSHSKHFNVKLVQPKTSLLKFIFGVITYAFFIFLVLILVTLLTYVLDIKIRAAKGDYSAPTFNAYVVLTGSMLPEIQVKDVVVTKKIDADDLKVGDIITFASSDSRFLGTIITHRIIKKNQDKDGNITFQTQGDNNNVADSALVQPNNIYGKVILKIPKLGYLQDFLATQGGWIIVILLPCMAVISYDIVKIAKGMKKRKNRINVIK